MYDQYKQDRRKKFKDEGFGITKKSEDALWRWMKEGLLRPREVEQISLIGGEPCEYRVQINTSHHIFELSGFSWGYGGEGPHGLLKMFQELKMPFTIKDIARWKQQGRYIIFKRKRQWVCKEIDRGDELEDKGTENRRD